MTNAKNLVAGIDYPRSLPEFDAYFPNEEACRRSRSRGLLFSRLMEQAVVTEVTTYRGIVDRHNMRQGYLR